MNQFLRVDTMAEQDVLVSYQAGVCHIQINRPDVKNSLRSDMYTQICEALDAAEADQDVRVILLSGVGGNFTSGNDLTDFAEGMQVVKSTPTYRYIETLKDLKKPLIAAVTGFAIGIGTTTLLHCDLVYTEADATLSLPFNKLGLCLEFGSSLLLSRIMGRAQAMELILMAEPFSGAKAKELGIVTDVVENAVEHSIKRAQKLAKMPPESTLLNKKLMIEPMAARTHDIVVEELKHFNEALLGPEFKEAVTAFMEKRAPDFSKKSP
jgi:enoyl-CoA hydratase/carnithine racemase